MNYWPGYKHAAVTRWMIAGCKYQSSNSSTARCFALSNVLSRPLSSAVRNTARSANLCVFMCVCVHVCCYCCCVGRRVLCFIAPTLWGGNTQYETCVFICVLPSSDSPRSVNFSEQVKYTLNADNHTSRFGYSTIYI